MKQYLDILSDILAHGEDRPNRTGIAAKSVFGRQMRFDLRNGFPLITTKKMAWHSIVAELLFLISGSQNVKDLEAHGVKIWSANAYADSWKPKAAFDGDMGRFYGAQWRRWQGADGKSHDQLNTAIELIRDNPDSRRIIVTAWNPAELDQVCLPPCHMFFQFYPDITNGLSMLMYQRSCDMFLGVPFNIASYALLLSLVAQVTNREPREFIHVLGDTHIYENHIDQAKIQITRAPLPLPQLKLNRQIRAIDAFSIDDIQLIGYQHHPPIKGIMAV